MKGREYPLSFAIQFLKGALTQNSETHSEVHHEGERVPTFLSYSILKGSPYLEQ